MPKLRKTIKKTKNNKSKRNRMRKMKGGNCGCSAQKGGGYGNSDTGHQPYKLNTFDHDPQNTLTNSRNVPDIKMGGKSRRRVRKMRGGGYGGNFSDWILGSSSNSNATLSFANSAGAFTGVNTLAGGNNTNYTVTNSPANNPYTNTSRPMLV